MITTEQLYKDMEQIAEETNCDYFCYEKLHSQNLTPGSNFDNESFFSKIEKKLGESCLENLYDEGIIHRNKNGGLSLKVEPSNEENGGVFLFIDDDYRILFFNNDCRTSGIIAAYHEAGHLMQDTYNILYSINEKKINDFYKRFKSKEEANSEIGKKFINLMEYNKYLEEAHAETFAAACLLLRTDNNKEFFSIASKLLRETAEYTTSSYKKGLEDNKYYSADAPFRAVIKKLLKYKHTGEISKFIDENKKIDFKTLAFETADIIKNKAYSLEQMSLFYKNKKIAKPTISNLGVLKNLIIANISTKILPSLYEEKANKDTETLGEQSIAKHDPHKIFPNHKNLPAKIKFCYAFHEIEDFLNKNNIDDCHIIMDKFMEKAVTYCSKNYKSNFNIRFKDEDPPVNQMSKEKLSEFNRLRSNFVKAINANKSNSDFMNTISDIYHPIDTSFILMEYQEKVKKNQVQNKIKKAAYTK